ncbi:MAG: hypothetical protein AAB344_05665, partial [Bacteroidota bacterium]
MIEQTKQIISQDERTRKLKEILSSLSSGESVLVTGLAGSVRALAFGSIAEELSKQILLVVADE